MVRLEAGIHDTAIGQAYLPYAIIARGFEDMSEAEQIEIKAILAARKEASPC